MHRAPPGLRWCWRARAQANPLYRDDQFANPLPPPGYRAVKVAKAKKRIIEAAQGSPSTR